MRLDAFLLADAASTPPDGKFYVHGGGLSRFVVPMLPFPLGVAVFIRFEVVDDDLRHAHDFRVSVTGPVGPNIAPLHFRAEAVHDPPPILEGEERYLHIALNLPLAIVRTGTYRLDLHVDDTLVRSQNVPLVLEGGGVDWMPST